MNISWDPNKAKINLDKHKVRFSDAEAVLFDPVALTREDDDAVYEQRFVSIGLDSLHRTLVVVYTYRGEDIRLISARIATPKERKCYEKGI
ncbi:MAG: BrnT family toxin [Candidatus Electrothrix sp. ATG2]|nr:BrnT family toxin [Candidatus Electrothrix sp. ATG2]